MPVPGMSGRWEALRHTGAGARCGVLAGWLGWIDTERTRWVTNVGGGLGLTEEIPNALRKGRLLLARQGVELTSHAVNLLEEYLRFRKSLILVGSSIRRTGSC
jgi:hypothetical protein